MFACLCVAVCNFLDGFLLAFFLVVVVVTVDVLLLLVDLFDYT